MTNHIASLNNSRPSTPIVGSSGSGDSTKAIPNYEKPLYERFASIYHTLLDLKNNRNKYINSKQVYHIYESFLDLLHELKITRKDEELKGMTLNLPNANDLLIDDIWQLVSLCFVTCGLIKFAPATYSSLSTVSKLLDHLRGCQVYTLDDLQPIKSRLDEVKSIIDNNNDDDDEDDEGNSQKNIHKIEENLLLRNKLNKCEALYRELEANFNNIPLDLEQTYNELISMRKTILNYLTNYDDNEVGPGSSSSRYNKIVAKVNQFKLKLKEIESTRDPVDGKFHSKEISDFDDNKLNSAQAVLNGLIDDCNNLLSDLLIQNDTGNLSVLLETSLDLKDDETTRGLKNINKRFGALYHQLLDLKVTLENLLVTRRWTMRETDLYTYQKSLKSIDDERIALNDQVSKLPREEAATSTIRTNINQHLRKNHILILYLLRRCYALIYKLLESSEPVSESLQPIHNQLSTVRKCLLEIKRVDGLNNLRELYPFQFKLASLDNLRSDGKFIINNTIPEGQGTLNALLAECFDIIYELKIELEEKEDNEDIEEDDPAAVSKVSHIMSDNNLSEMTDDEDIQSDDEVELKRKRFMGFNEADYDQESESAFDDDDYSLSESEFEGNDYY
ncbi:hypothetical protein G9P44_000058 [Scheffersomyces stipitis]|nr:hypothetical protein G9P44_000058 [Scheffersomyces stipitis]